MTDIMGYEEIIEKIKQETGATDEEIAQRAQEIEKRYGPVIKTKDFLYYRVAEDVYKIKLPKITDIGKSRKLQTVKVKDLMDNGTALKFAKDNISIAIEGFAFGQIRGKSQKGNPKVTFYLIDKTGSISAMTAGEEATQNWDDVGIDGDDMIRIEGASVFMRDKKDRPRISISRYSTISKKKTKETLDDILVNVSENVADDGSIVYAEGYVTDGDKKSYLGCKACYKRMTDKDGNVLKECPKCGKKETETFNINRLNIFDGAVSIIVAVPPQISKVTKTDGLVNTFVRVYGRWNGKMKEISYLKHQSVDKFSPMERQREKLAAKKKEAALPKLKKLKDEEIEEVADDASEIKEDIETEAPVPPTPAKKKQKEEIKEEEEEETEEEEEEKPKQKTGKKTAAKTQLTDEQLSVFEGVVKFYRQASVSTVTKQLISKAGVTNDIEAANIINIAEDMGIVKKIKNGSALEWVKE